MEAWGAPETNVSHGLLKMLLVAKHRHVQDSCTCAKSLRVCVLNHFSHVQFFSTMTTRLLCPWYSLGKNTGVGCHFLLHRMFPTQGSNLRLMHCRWILYFWASGEAYPGFLAKVNPIHGTGMAASSTAVLRAPHGAQVAVRIVNPTQASLLVVLRGTVANIM